MQKTKNKIKLLTRNNLYHLTFDEVVGNLIVSNDDAAMYEGNDTHTYVSFSKLEFPEDNKIQLAIIDLVGRLFSFMPNSIEDGYKYIPLEFMPAKYQGILEDKIDAVTFFGGSFNPWHDGHKECLEQCREFEDFIVVVPDYSPWKNNTKVEPLSELIELSNKLGGEFIIYPGFWAVEGRNPTSNWIDQVDIPTKNYLMGDDTFKSILKWINAPKVIGSFKSIYVVPRDFENSELLDNVEEIKKIKPDINIVFLKEHSYQNLSSTQLRK